MFALTWSCSRIAVASSGRTEWHNMMRPCGLYVTRGKSLLAIVGELGPVATLTAGVPNLGPRVSMACSVSAGSAGPV